ncbi:hypothetical protein TNCV_2259921 [Trichonephila clavipes]|nr:hypothetical protein TNCV_2259921 [Trichonephila clavipes]
MAQRLRHVKGALHIMARVTNEERNVRSEYLPFRTQVLYRPGQNDRLRVMLVLVHIDITPPQANTFTHSFLMVQFPLQRKEPELRRREPVLGI